MSTDVKAAVDAAFRDEWGRVVATLIRTTGDWDLARNARRTRSRWPCSGGRKTASPAGRARG